MGKTSFAIDISGIPAGMYWLRAGSKAARFVKE
jgi:hypothetical protein